MIAMILKKYLFAPNVFPLFYVVSRENRIEKYEKLTDTVLINSKFGLDFCYTLYLLNLILTAVNFLI